MGEGAYLTRGMYRNRKLLDCAHAIEHCTNCGAYQVEGCEPAHSNLEEHGKGKGLKGHDCFWAALCHACHAWLDNSGGLGTDPTRIWKSTREDKKAMFVRAMFRTWLELWRLEKLLVSLRGEGPEDSIDLSQHGAPRGYAVRGTPDAIEWLRQQLRTLPVQQKGWGGQ